MQPGGRCGQRARQFILVPFDPSSAWSGSLGSLGSDVDAGLLGLDPHPDPADPPLLIITIVPGTKPPAGPISMKFPPPFNDSCTPASRTIVIPAFRWIACPASCAKFCPDFSYRFCPAWIEMVCPAL